jgi:hypothetical protein
VTIELDDFGWRGLCEEAERQGVDVETLVEHAAMYFLADVDSGRAAVQIFRRSVADRAPGKVSRLRDRDGSRRDG